MKQRKTWLILCVLLSTTLLYSEDEAYPGRSGSIPARTLSSKSIFHGSRDLKLVALTYDDGPNRRFTPRLLDLLESEQVPATFFWLGEQVKIYPQEAQRVAEMGFEIGNHTFDHSNPTKLSPDELRQQIVSTQDIISQTVGITPTVFRPPYGSVNSIVRDVVHDLGMDVILWRLDTEDWRSGSSKDQIVATVLDRIKAGDIILMHDRNSRTIDATRELIPRLRERGFSFVTVSGLLRAETLPEKIEKFGQSPLLKVILFTPPFAG